MSVAIKFENISKQYRLGSVGTGTLSHDLNRWWTMNIRRKEDPYLKIGSVNDRGSKADSDYVWALRDINFEVQQGEVLGIIGKNGAGKSTLLKILSKVTSPTTGEIKARGRIASLLEVGTGFHPEMTGRENIYMNGAIMGMTKAEIRRKMDEIVDFSDCERFIDTPVKRYSSGMTVRLGFAVAAHLEPEILVVDEVLAVGDAEFQKKAIGKMQDISKGEGRTVLFVSHNMTAVENICSKICTLVNGEIKYLGDVDSGVKIYLESTTIEQNGIAEISYNNHYNNEILKLTGFDVIQDKLKDNFVTAKPIEIFFHYEIIREIVGLRIGFDLIDLEKDIILFRTFHDDNSNEFENLSPGHYTSKAEIPAFLLKPGYFSLSISIGIHSVKWIIHDLIKYKFTLYNIGGINKIYADKRPGIIMPYINWENRKDVDIKL